MITAESVAKKLKKSQRKSPTEWIACCPAHSDRTPSLSISTGDDGRILWHCHAGCDQLTVRAALETVGAIEKFVPWDPKTAKKAFPESYPCPRTHTYRDADGKPVYVVRRLANADGTKTFKQASIQSGKLVANMKGITRLPYNLHLFKGEPHIFIVEGEQAADALTRRGYLATCNSGGAGKWTTELNEWFKNVRVTLAPDNDEPGRKHMESVANHLKDVAASVTIANLCASLKDKDDVVQWLATNPDKDIFEETAKFQPVSGSAVTPIPDFPESMDFRSGDQIKMVTISNWIVKDIIPVDGMGAAYGKPSSGKTFWALDLALHIAGGKGYRDKRTKQGLVVYIPLEAGERFQNRIVQAAKVLDVDLNEHLFWIQLAQINLLEKNQKGIKEFIAGLRILEQKTGRKIAMIIVDTLSRAIPGGNENAPEDMTAFVSNCDFLWKEFKAFLLIIHHTGKDESRGMRGHSSLLGAVDTEIEIKTIEGTDSKTKVARVSKQRDDVEGEELGFSLEKVQCGLDSDGDHLTTCVVKHVSDEDIKDYKSKAMGLSGQHLEALNHLDNTLAKSGTLLQPEPGMTTQLTTTIAAWRDRCGDKGLSESQTEEAEKKAFNRSLKALKNKGIVSTFQDLVWKVGTSRDMSGT